MEEIWKPIVGYEGLYEVSNLGKVKSFYCKWGPQKGNIILKPGKSHGYSHINLVILGYKKSCDIHRIVAQHFIPNPNNLPLVCHKKEDLDENGFLYNGEDNLFWGTYSDNTRDMTRKGRSFVKGKKGSYSHLAKKVYQYTKDGCFIKEWGSQIEAGIELGIARQSISSCCRKGKHNKSAGGFIWKFN